MKYYVLLSGNGYEVINSNTMESVRAFIKEEEAVLYCAKLNNG